MTDPAPTPSSAPLVPAHLKILNTIEEAAALWSVSKRTMEELIRTGIVPVVRHGRRVLVPRTALDQAWEKLESAD
jgi:excisionase family DNA binding protein